MYDSLAIRWEFDKISELTGDGRESPIEYHYGVPWSVFVRRENSQRTKNIPHFGIFLCCNEESDCSLWTCKLELKYVLVHRANEQKNVHKDYINLYEKAHSGWGFSRFISFMEILKPNRGFIKDDKVIVEVHFKIHSINFIRKMHTYDFTQPFPNADNVALKLKDGTINVCRKFLGWHSPYFASIFSENCRSSNTEFEVNNSSVKDFIELLHAIFPSERPINIDSYKPILKLANLFQIERAFALVENFLILTENVSTSAKILLAEEYGLGSLKSHCFNSFTDLKDLKELKVLRGVFKMLKEFTIRWEIDNISKLTSVPRVSPNVHHHNFPWRLAVKNETSNRTLNIPHMGLFLCCNHESTCELWSCEHSSQLIVCNRIEEKNLTMPLDCIYRGKGMTDWGCPRMIEFSTLLRPGEGFVKNDKAVVEARVSVKQLQFIRRDAYEIDFAQPTLSADNIMLKLKDGTVNVCRRFMMWHSPYFASVFIKENEDCTNDIKLKDISRTDIIKLLDVIYPSQKSISYESYQPILKLAKLFQIERALELVENYLIPTRMINNSIKLLLAVEYDLESLKTHCFDSFKTLNAIKNLQNDTEFSSLPAKLKVSLLSKAFELIK